MGRTIRDRPLLEQVRKFVAHHIGKSAFGPFTGQDYPAWSAFVHLVECYSRGGGSDAIDAMAATVRCAQPSSVILAPFVQAIPAVMDWTTIAELWPPIIARADHGRMLGLWSSKMHLLRAIERDGAGIIVRNWGASEELTPPTIAACVEARQRT